MKRNIRILIASLIIVVLLITSVVPALAVATGKVTTYNTTHYFQSYANSRWSDLKTPRHALSSDKSLIFYCLQHKKSTPKGQGYTLANVMDSYNATTRNGIYAIMFNGYPFNSYGMSAEKAFYATANALRCWLAERGDSQHYNMSKLNGFNASQLRNLAASGIITNKMRVKDAGNIAMMKFMVELLISARNQETVTHNIYLDTMDVKLVNSGNYFTGTSQVTIENLRGGYQIDASELPEGSSVTGYNGTSDDNLNISIPVTTETAGKTYSISLNGYDDRVPENIRAFDAQDATYQRVLGVYAGTSYMQKVCTINLVVTTPSNPMPDLTITRLTADKTEYNGGDKVTVMATVYNQGGTDAEAFETAVELEGVSPIRKECSGLAAGASVDLTYEFTAPILDTEDTLDVLGFVDYNNVVVESNETNNDAVASVNILAAKPDITITSLKTDKSSYAGSETITVKATVKNKGNKSADAFDVSLTATGMDTQIKALSGMDAGGSKTLTYTYTAPSGSSGTNIDFLAFADCNDEVDESNENNNKAEAEVSVNAVLPDLTIESVAPDPGIAKQDDTATITVVVVNQGNKDVASSDVKLVIGSEVVGTKVADAIPAGGRTTITFTYTVSDDAPAGTLDIVATVDPANEIKESNETNNTGTNTMQVEVRLPDLTVASVIPESGVVQPGDTVKITVVVGNDGDRDVSSSQLALNIGGEMVGTLPVENLPAGGTTTIVFEYIIPDSMPEGILDIVGTVDPGNLIRESNEDNNIGRSAIGVEIILPDLEIVATNACDWNSLMDVVVIATVRNNMPKSVPSVPVRLTIGNETYEERICVPGSAENLAVFRITVPDEIGRMDISFVVDPNNEIEEMSESNNDLSHSVEIAALPNGTVLDPDDPDLQAIYESRGLSGMPELDQSKTHSWQEYRYENGSYVLHDYHAKLEMKVDLSPDARVAYEEIPDVIESGFGVSIAVKTELSTNYDHAEKLVGVQRVWCWSPESGYGELSGYSDVFDSLQTKEGSSGDKVISWQYKVNPHSEKDSRLHYTPLWFPDGSYRIQAQGFQAWSPAGEMYATESDAVTIDGDMYDRVTAVN